MSEPAELINELRWAVRAAQNDRRADAWRHLAEISRLVGQLDMRVNHLWKVIGNAREGFRVVCPCGWETDRYPYAEVARLAKDHQTAATEAGGEHGLSSAVVMRQWTEALGPFGEDD